MKRSEKSGRNSRRVLFFLTPLIILGIGISLYWFMNRPESSPTAVRPWAEARFMELTAPTPSAGDPLDARYAVKINSQSDRPEPKWHRFEIGFDEARENFVRSFPIHSFNAADGWSAGGMDCDVRWFATRQYESQPSPLPAAEFIRYFDRSGTPLPDSGSPEEQVMPDHHGSREMDTSLSALVKISGLREPRWYLREVFDATTRAPLLRRGDIRKNEEGILLGTSLKTLHHPALLVVFDAFHGEEEAFSLLPQAGASLTGPGFRLDVMQAAGSQMGYMVRNGRTLYSWDRSDDSRTSLLLRCAPRSAWESLDFEVMDASGITHATEPQVRDLHKDRSIQILEFGIPLSRVQSVIVRRKPLLDRFIMRLDALPGARPGDAPPADLFDVVSPKMTFDDPSEMQYYIGNTIQFDTVGGAKGYRRRPGFPMTMEHVTPRAALSRYLSLPGKRFARIDPARMTIEFDDNLTPSLFEKTIAAAKRKLGIP